MHLHIVQLLSYVGVYEIGGQSSEFDLKFYTFCNYLCNLQIISVNE